MDTNLNLIAALVSIAVAIVTLAAIIWVRHRHYVKVRHQVELERKQREEEKRIRKLKSLQNEYGDVLFNALTEAARQNTAANLLEGKPSRNVGLIEIERMRDNGGQYSIIASMPDPTCHTMGGFTKAGYPLLQIDINLQRKEEVHVFHAPYGPERRYPLGQFDYVKYQLCGYVREYQLFNAEGVENKFAPLFTQPA